MRPIHVGLLVAGLIVVAVLWWLGSPAREQESLKRELAALDPSVRARLYASHRRDFDELCGRGTELVGYCEQIAGILSTLPECDVDCRMQIAPWLPSASR